MIKLFGINMKKNTLHIILLICYIFFFSVIDSKGSEPALNKRTINFGKLPKSKDKIIAVYTLYNHTNENILIKKIDKTCGCTTIKYTKAFLRKGDFTKIYINIDIKSINGFFLKSAYIRFFKHPPLLLKIKGYKESY